MKIPYRTWIGVMIFSTTATNYAFRAYFPITLIAIIERNRTVKLDNGTHVPEEQSDYGRRYPYTPMQEGQLIGAYFYGYTSCSLFGGPIAEYFGPYWTISVTTLASAVVTCLSVLMVMKSWIPLFICRFVVGMLGSCQYPALQCLMGVWAPPAEKGKFVACLMGNVLGTVITQSTVGVLIQSTESWKWGFFFCGFASILFLIAWMLLTSDDPEKNWFCSEEEAAFIQEAHGGSIKKGKSKPPVLKMITSVPFIILVLTQFGNLWGLYFLLTAVPKFMKDVLEFKLKDIGFLSSLPSFARLLFGFVFGSLADFMLKRQVFTKAKIRKGFTFFSHILPGTMMFLYLGVGQSVPIALLLLVLMMTFNGAAVVTCLANPQDLAPNFAGSQFGVMNFFGSMTGFIIPSMVAAITEKRSEYSEWAIVFGISGTIYVFAGILFIFFGSVELQPWNEKKPLEQQQPSTNTNTS